MKPFHGTYTALVTPFKGGRVDFASLDKLIQYQLAGGVNGFVVNGTTAESPTLTDEESLEILNHVLKTTQGKAHVIFGSGSNATRKTVELSQKAQAAGAQGLLVVVPYYNKPPQAGLYQHFKTVAESVDVPVMLYNVPGRTVTSLTSETVQALAQIKNIVAIKEATGKMDFGREILGAVPPTFTVSSGDDETCLDLQRFGGKGVVSVCSHIMPTKMSRWFAAPVSETDYEDFQSAKPLIASLYMMANPIPVKAALHIMGILASDEVRLPLCTLEPVQKKSLEQTLKTYERHMG